MSSFYRSTSGFRNALRENLGFRGAKVGRQFHLSIFMKQSFWLLALQ